MNYKTEKAIDGAIKKWKDIFNGTNEDQGVDNCPLCKIFWFQFCVGCPVNKATKKPYCLDTPHWLWVQHHDAVHKEDCTSKTGLVCLCDECRDIAQQEIDFLSLLRE